MESTESRPYSLDAAVTKTTECTSCNNPHDQDEMSHCVICSGYYCLYCSCNCVPITEDLGDSRNVPAMPVV
jgi:hypothetical protein